MPYLATSKLWFSIVSPQWDVSLRWYQPTPVAVAKVTSGFSTTFSVELLLLTSLAT